MLAEFSTDHNKLSVWRIEKEEDLNDVFVAMASNRPSIGKLEFAKIFPEDISDLSFDDEEGDTPTFGINQKHGNILDLNYVTLGDVILCIAHSIDKNGTIMRTRSQVRSLLVDAYKNHKLDIENMEPKVAQEILVYAENTLSIK